MAKLKVQGNASGTGVVTLTAPDTNTDRTITLPDGDISLGVGIDDNATSTAITIDASENVGIGTTSPTTKLNVGFAGADAVNTFRLEGSNGSSERFAFDIEADGGNSAVNFKVGSGGGAPTEKLRLTSDGRGLSDFTAKAWIRVNQTGTQSINDSHNISSISDGGVGKTTAFFANSMANTNYAVTFGADFLSWGSIVFSDNFATASFLLAASNGSGYEDQRFVHGVVYGD